MYNSAIKNSISLDTRQQGRFVLGADLEADINQRELIMDAVLKKKESPKTQQDNIDKAESPKTEHNKDNKTESPQIESPKIEHIGIQMAHSVLNGIEIK